MFNPIIIMRKGTARVVRWVNINAFNLPCELLLKGFKGKEIIAENEAVIKEVFARNAMRGVMRLRRVFEQDARL